MWCDVHGCHNCQTTEQCLRTQKRALYGEVESLRRLVIQLRTRSEQDTAIIKRLQSKLDSIRKDLDD